MYRLFKQGVNSSYYLRHLSQANSYGTYLALCGHESSKKINLTDIYDCQNFHFYDQFFIGHKDTIVPFCQNVKAALLDLKCQGRIVWASNTWTLAQAKENFEFDWYQTDGYDSIIRVPDKYTMPNLISRIEKIGTNLGSLTRARHSSDHGTGIQLFHQLVPLIKYMTVAEYVRLLYETQIISFMLIGLYQINWP